LSHCTTKQTPQVFDCVVGFEKLILTFPNRKRKRKKAGRIKMEEFIFSTPEPSKGKKGRKEILLTRVDSF